MGKSGAARVKSGDMAYGKSAVSHELRQDFKGAKRQVRNTPPLIWSPYSTGQRPIPAEWRDIEDEEQRKQLELERIRDLIHVAKERRNFTMLNALAAHVDGAKKSAAAKQEFLHALLQFPTDLAITPETEREMLAQGVAFINQCYGGNAAFHARLDRDEKGRHTVDVFFAPRYEKETAPKGEKGKKVVTEWISLSKFSKQMARDRFGQQAKLKRVDKTDPKTGLKKTTFEPVKGKDKKPVMIWNDSGYFQGRALQDAFFEHLRDGMGLDWVVRGDPKKNRDHDRLEPEEYAAKAEAERFRKTVTQEAELMKPGMIRLKGQETPYTGVARELVVEAHQRATESAAEAVQDLQGEVDDLEASIAPLRSAVDAMDAFRAQGEAYQAAQEETRSLYRIEDVWIKPEERFGGRLHPSQAVITATSYASGQTTYWDKPADTESSFGQKMRKAFVEAKAAGKELWVKVTDWIIPERGGEPVPGYVELPDSLPTPPVKPKLAQEVVRLLSMLDEKTLAAVRGAPNPSRATKASPQGR